MTVMQVMVRQRIVLEGRMAQVRERALARRRQLRKLIRILDAAIAFTGPQGRTFDRML